MAGRQTQPVGGDVTSSGRRGWQGRSRASEVVRYRWQRDWTTAGSFLSRSTWRKIRVGALTAAFLLLLAFLVRALLFAPTQTPLLTIASTRFTWPIEPTAWIAEDLQGLQSLDQKTISLRDLSESFAQSDAGLTELDVQLEAFRQRLHHADALIVYVAMPGVVDDNGNPCLLTPASLPHQPETWLPLSEVFSRIKAQEIASSTPKLVVLDCQRRQADWNLGIGVNTFVDRIEAAVTAAELPGLVVMTSTSAGESAHGSSEMQASMFGRYFRLGLAGAADGRRYGGNGNGRVTLRELHSYMKESVGQAVEHHWQASQTPQLFPADFPNRNIAWALRSTEWRELVAEAGRTQRAEPNVAVSSLAQHWKRFESLRGIDAYRWDPLGWRQLEHALLQLEELAQAGAAYRDEASKAASDLDERLSQIETRAAAFKLRPSLPSAAVVLSGREDFGAAGLKAHSLPIAELLGSIDPATAKALRSQLADCQRLPADDLLDATRAALQEALPATETVEGRFLGLMRRYHTTDLWGGPNQTSLAIAARLQASNTASGANPTAATADERALVSLFAELQAADRERRQAEDQLLIGPQVDSGQLTKSWQDASERYTAIEQSYTGLAAILRLNDEVCAQLPYLAAWLARPTTDPQTAAENDSEITRTLLPLIGDVRRLNITLAADGEAAAGGNFAIEAEGLRVAIRERFDRLKGIFDAHLRRLTAAKPDDAGACRDIAVALACPLIAAETREQLRVKQHEIDAEVHARFDLRSQPKAAAAADDTESRNGPSLLQRTYGVWRRQPLALLLGEASTMDEVESTPTVKSADFVAAAERTNTELRHTLVMLATLDREAADHAAQSQKGVRRRRQALSAQDAGRWEAEIRAAAPIWFALPPDDPIQRARQCRIQQLMLFHAKRSLDDFYGSAGSPGEPFFAVAAADYLSTAKTIVSPDSAAATQIQELDNLLAERVLSSRQSMALTATDILLLDYAQDLAAKIVVQPGPVEARQQLPFTEAAVFLADSQGRVGLATRAIPASELSVADAAPVEWSTTLDSAELATRGPMLEAIATVRGNEFAAPVILRGAGGRRVEAAYHNYGPPQVTVFGYQRHGASLMLVLDCSQSMREILNVETAGENQVAGLSRLEIAKGALRSLLDDLAERGDSRVGVRFYGHRVGRSTTTAEKILRQTNYVREIPPEVMPFNDVELVLPLGRFDAGAAAKVRDVLRSVAPWGESPLYLALTQSLQDFAAEEPGADKAIVVITDGLNYQFNPTAEFARTRDEVLTQWRRNRVPIHIIGFGLRGGEAETARQEFTRLAEETGGEFFPATDASELLQSLESVLRQTTVKVTGNGFDEETPLGSTIAIRPKPAHREAFLVDAGGAEQLLELDGGENVELAFSRDNSRLEVLRYSKGSPQYLPLNGANAPSMQPQLGVHRALRNEDSVTLPFSLVDADRRFLPRPAEVWIEATPQGEQARRQEKFIFYDVNFEPETSVPVLRCVARGWPKELNAAEVRFWCKPVQTPPDYVIQLATVADKAPPDGLGWPVDDLADVTFQVRSLAAANDSGRARIGLVERHGPLSEGVGSLKVELSPLPTNVVRQFDYANRVVVHTFEYDANRAATAPIEIRFTTRGAMQAGAWSLDSAAAVDIANEQDLLPLRSPRN